jgi:hypothetical protein
MKIEINIKHKYLNQCFFTYKKEERVFLKKQEKIVFLNYERNSIFKIQKINSLRK